MYGDGEATIFISVTATPWKWEPFLPDASTTCTYALSSRFPFVCVSSLSFPSFIPFLFSRLSHLGRGAPAIRDWFVTGAARIPGRGKKVARALVPRFNGYYSDQSLPIHDSPFEKVAFKRTSNQFGVYEFDKVLKLRSIAISKRSISSQGEEVLIARNKTCDRFWIFAKFA